MSPEQELDAGVSFVKPHLPKGLPLAIVLGSAFQKFAQNVVGTKTIPYQAIPGFHANKVAGHRGKLILAQMSGHPVVLLAGRSHLYEGYTFAEVTFPIRLLARLGVRTVLLTNAAGGISPKFRTGDFMIFSDHLNLMGGNPLEGPLFGPTAFLDLTKLYDEGLQRILLKAARETGSRAFPGIYAAVKGPTYETPAEIRAFKRLGADAVGMSTVPEAIVARHLGIRVGALSCITNLAAGRSKKPLLHEEVLRIGERISSQATKLLTQFAKIYAESGL